MTEERMILNFEVKGNDLPMEVDLDMTISGVKNMLSNMLGDPPESMNLQFKYRKKMLDLENEKKVRFYKENRRMRKKANVKCVISRSIGGIFILEPLMRTHIQLYPGTRVEDVKRRIESRRQIKMKEQELLYEGKVLMDSTLLSDLGITAGCHLSFLQKTFEVEDESHFVVVNGGLHQFRISLPTTFEEFQYLLQRRHGNNLYSKMEIKLDSGSWKRNLRSPDFKRRIKGNGEKLLVTFTPPKFPTRNQISLNVESYFKRRIPEFNISTDATVLSLRHMIARKTEKTEKQKNRIILITENLVIVPDTEKINSLKIKDIGLRKTGQTIFYVPYWDTKYYKSFTSEPSHLRSRFYQPEVEQTDEAMSVFLSCLYYLSKKMNSLEHSDYQARKHHLIDSFEANIGFLPATAAFRKIILSDGGDTSSEEKIILTYSIYELLRERVPQTSPDILFSFSRDFFMFVLYHAMKSPGGAKTSEELWVPGVTSWERKMMGCSGQTFRRSWENNRIPRSVIGVPFGNIQRIVSRSSDFKIYGIKEGGENLKMSKGPLLVWYLSGIMYVFTGKHGKNGDTLHFFNPMKKLSEGLEVVQTDTITEDIKGGIRELVGTPKTLKKDETIDFESIVDHRKVEEAIAIVCDVSRSMKMLVKDFGSGNNMSRKGIAVALLLAFVDRTYEFDHPHRICLIKFARDIRTVVPFTNDFGKIKREFNDLECDGRATYLFNAMDHGINELIRFRSSDPKHRDCKLRLFVFSDGMDNKHSGPRKTSFDVLSKCLANQISVDSYLIGPRVDIRMKGISYRTNGYCLRSKDLQVGLRLFQSECVLRRSSRPEFGNRNVMVFRNDADIREYSQRRSYQENVPEIPLPAELGREYVFDPAVKRLNLIAQELSGANRESTTVRTTKRVMKELRLFYEDRRKDIEIFPCRRNFLFWKIALKAPEGSIYCGGNYVLYCRFPEEYPEKPPEIRFVTKIFHCNINNDGKICHPILGRSYQPNYQVRVLLEYVMTLLVHPEPDDALDRRLAIMYREDLDKYVDTCKKHMEEVNAGKTFAQLCKEVSTEFGGKVKNKYIKHVLRTFSRVELERTQRKKMGTSSDPDPKWRDILLWRFCPKCAVPVKRKDDAKCKHTFCRRCGQYFCHICLSKRNSDGRTYPCDPLQFFCGLKPVQGESDIEKILEDN